jgi:hypothetical protein
MREDQSLPFPNPSVSVTFQTSEEKFNVPSTIAVEDNAIYLEDDPPAIHFQATSQPGSLRPRSATKNRDKSRRGGAALLSRLKPSRVELVLENSGSVARDHLALERTFFAYVRTSLVTATTGVGK